MSTRYGGSITVPRVSRAAAAHWVAPARRPRQSVDRGQRAWGMMLRQRQRLRQEQVEREQADIYSASVIDQLTSTSTGVDYQAYGFDVGLAHGQATAYRVSAQDQWALVGRDPGASGVGVRGQAPGTIRREEPNLAEAWAD